MKHWRQLSSWRRTDPAQAGKAKTARERWQRKRTRGSLQGTGVLMLTCTSREFAGSPREQTGTYQRTAIFKGDWTVCCNSESHHGLSTAYLRKCFSSSKVPFFFFLKQMSWFSTFAMHWFTSWHCFGTHKLVSFYMKLNWKMFSRSTSNVLWQLMGIQSIGLD